MMDFIAIPLTVGIITLGIYKLFELFARKKERLTLIEKMGDKFDPAYFQTSFPTPVPSVDNGSYGSLKAGFLLVGVGFGLLFGFFVLNQIVPNIGLISEGNEYGEIASIVFGSSVLLFGGASLIAAFILETRLRNKEKSK